MMIIEKPFRFVITLLIVLITLITFHVNAQILNSLPAGSQPTAAFSLRKLKAGVVYAIKVKRSDNALKDIGFDANGNLDVASLLTFAGGGSLYVNTWYDQTGNGRHVIAPANANQPRIVNAGNVDMQDNRPAILWSNTTPTKLLAAQPLLTSTVHTINIVNKLNRTSGFQVMVGNSSTNYFGYTGGTQLVLNTNLDSRQQIYSTSQTKLTNILTNIRNVGAGATYKNGILLSKNTGTLTTSNASINGLGGFSTYGLSGTMPEVLLFNLILSTADRILLETNQKAYYKSPSLRVACVGNSITWGYTIPSPEINSYPAQLQAKLGSGYTVSNYGNPGKTMQIAPVDAYTKTLNYSDALASQPDIVLIKLGTNDSKFSYRGTINANFKNDCKAIIQAFENITPKPRIILMQPAPCFTTGNPDINAAIIRDQITPLVVQAAAEKGLQVIDLYSPLINRPDLFPDKVHPNTEGAGIIATTIYNFLRGTGFTSSSTLSSTGSSDNFMLVKATESSTLTEFKIYASSTDQSPIISVQSAIVGKATIRITDISGQKISEQSLYLEKGNNNLKTGIRIQPGWYVATLTTQTEKISVKFVCQ